MSFPHLCVQCRWSIGSGLARTCTRLSTQRDDSLVKGEWKLERRLTSRYKDAGEALRRKQDKEREANGLPPIQRTGGRGGAPGQGQRAKDLPTGKSAPFSRIGGGRNHTNRNGGQGPPPPATRGGRGGGGAGRGGGGRGGGRGQLDQNVWTHLIAYLRKHKLLPVVNFVFSKKRCEEYAQTLSTTDLCDAKEKSEVHIVWEKALTRLKGKLNVRQC